MSKILLKENRTTGAQTFYETAGDETHRTSTVQDVTDILEHAKEMRQVTEGQAYGDMRKMGVMPMSVIGQAMREGWLMDQNKMREWFRLNPAFKTFDKDF